MVSITKYHTIRKSQYFDKFSFLWIFLLGASSIIFLKTAIYESAHFEHIRENHAYVLILPISFMFIYLWLVIKTERFRLRYDQAGDNLYYLGFLYTLTSLAVALYHFTIDIDESLKYLISSFGIALSTTITGVALRVLLHQMHVDPMDVEREAHIQITETMSRLRSELDNSVVDLNHFRRQARQSTEESLREMAEIVNRLLEETTEKVNQQLITSSKQVGDVATKTAEEIEKAFSNYNEPAKKLNQASRRTVNATEKLVDRIEKIDIPQDIIQKKVECITDPLAQFVEKIITRERLDNKIMVELSNSTNNLLYITNEMMKNFSLINDGSSVILNFVEKIETLTPSLKEIEVAVKNSATSFQNVSGFLDSFSNKQVKIFQEQVNMLNNLLEKMAEQQDAFSATISNQAKSAAQHTNHAMQTLSERQKEIYDVFSKQTIEILDSIKSNRQQTEKEISKANEAANELISQLSSMANALSENLSANSQ